MIKMFYRIYINQEEDFSSGTYNFTFCTEIDKLEMIKVVSRQLQKLDIFMKSTKETEAKLDSRLIYQIMSNHLMFYESALNLGVNLCQEGKEVAQIDSFLEICILNAKKGYEMVNELKLTLKEVSEEMVDGCVGFDAAVTKPVLGSLPPRLITLCTLSEAVSHTGDSERYRV
jgi:hypothetical protein